jgi:hypothetical protein
MELAPWLYVVSRCLMSCNWYTFAEPNLFFSVFFKKILDLQADDLRRRILEQMQHILTTRQSARALLAISDYLSRLRALSSLWIARPRE